MKKSPKTHPSFYSFKDAADFQNFLRSGSWKDGELDYITFAGLVYTMHEYDSDGEQITWANKKHNKMVECKTYNRYRLGYNDAEVFDYDAPYLRNDINYYQ